MEGDTWAGIESLDYSEKQWLSHQLVDAIEQVPWSPGPQGCHLKMATNLADISSYS